MKNLLLFFLFLFTTMSSGNAQSPTYSLFGNWTAKVNGCTVNFNLYTNQTYRFISSCGNYSEGTWAVYEDVLISTSYLSVQGTSKGRIKWKDTNSFSLTIMDGVEAGQIRNFRRGTSPIIDEIKGNNKKNTKCTCCNGKGSNTICLVCGGDGVKIENTYTVPCTELFCEDGNLTCGCCSGTGRE